MFERESTFTTYRADSAKRQREIASYFERPVIGILQESISSHQVTHYSGLYIKMSMYHQLGTSFVQILELVIQTIKDEVNKVWISFLYWRYTWIYIHLHPTHRMLYSYTTVERQHNGYGARNDVPLHRISFRPEICDPVINQYLRYTD